MEAMPARVNEKGLEKIDENGGICGDVPHGWVAAHYILLLRNMLFYEDGDRMFLLPCIPEAWLNNTNTIEIKNAPTFFGNFEFRIDSHLQDGFIKISLNCARPPAKGYILKLPVKQKIKTVNVNGNNWENFTESSISLPPKTKSVVVKFQS